VEAEDDGRYWVIRVRDRPELVSWAPRFDSALRMVREMIARVEQADPSSIDIHVDFQGKVSESTPVTEHD
jgi:hypothetical protein